MAKTKLTGKDLILLLLYVPGSQGRCQEPVIGRTRLMKMVFLFEAEVWPKFKFDRILPKDVLPDFTPYDFGPYASDVYADLEFLTTLGFIEVRRDYSGQTSEEEALEYQWWQAEAVPEEEQTSTYPFVMFCLTERGRQFVVERLVPRLSDDQLDALAMLKAKCTGMKLRALLKYVYTKYPESAKNSKIRDELLGVDWE